MLTGTYAAFHRSIADTIPSTRIFTDELRTLAYGTDASFYRLIPNLVVKVESEEEIVRVLAESRRLRLPVLRHFHGPAVVVLILDHACSPPFVTPESCFLRMIGRGIQGVSHWRQEDTYSVVTSR